MYFLFFYKELDIFVFSDIWNEENRYYSGKLLFLRVYAVILVYW